MNSILASAIGAVVSAAITLLILSVKGVFSIEKRLSICEVQLKPFTQDWHTKLENRMTKLESRDLFSEVMKVLHSITPKGNPIDPTRYQQLLNKMQANALTPQEASELNSALIELKEEAEHNNNMAAVLAIALALIILAAAVSKK